jgi:Ca2+-binding RTX toxin-like protein
MRRTASLAFAVSALSLGVQPAASGAGASEPSPVEFGDCFGPYSDIVIGSSVIFAEESDWSTMGTSGDDVIIGSDGEDQIFGLEGNDRICAGDGNDYVESGPLGPGSGAEDSDHIDGGAGSDVLHGGQKADFVYGGTNFTPADDYHSSDWLYGDNGDDWLFGESGPDVLDGGTGPLDFCDGGTGMTGNRPEDDSTTGGCETLLRVP